MKEKDVVSLTYMDDDERIADLINVYFYEGEQKVAPEDVQEMDSTVRKIQKIWGKISTWSYTRDFLRKIVLGREVLIIGVEHQSDIDPAMPVRVMGYDVNTYEKQIRRLKKIHKRKKDLSSKEYIRGLSMEDRLAPVITIVLYFGEEEWSGPMDLHGLLELGGEMERLKQYIPNYRFHVLEVRRYEYWEKFTTDMKLLFGYLREIKNKQTLLKYLEENKEAYQHLSEDTFDLICAVTDVEELNGIKEEGRKEQIDMCKTWENIMRELREDAQREAREEVRKEVQEEVRKEVQEEVRKEVRKEVQEEVRKEVQKKAREEGQEQLAALIQVLIRQKRINDVERVVKDKIYRDRMYQEVMGRR